MTDLANIDLSSTPFTWTTLTRISGTELVPSQYRGKPDAMLAAIYLGRELGLGPMQSLQMIDVIDGRPSLSAELQTAMIRAAGHSITPDEITPQGVTLTGTRADNCDTLTVTFTWADAERAGLTGKRNWQHYPVPMLWARAVSMLARMLFADVFAATHAYTPQDLDPDAAPPTIEDPEPEAAVEVAGVVELAPRGDQGAAYDLFISLLNTDFTGGTMPEIEAHVRELARLGTALGYVSVPPDSPYPDWLHAVLADHDAEHVGDLRRAELIEFALDLRGRLADAEMDQGPPQ